MALPRAPQRQTPAFAFSHVERAIREGVGHHGYKPQSVVQRLSESERAELQAIRRLVEEGRRRLGQLVSNHRTLEGSNPLAQPERP
jgi:hypothetical protein